MRLDKLKLDLEGIDDFLLRLKPQSVDHPIWLDAGTGPNGISCSFTVGQAVQLRDWLDEAIRIVKSQEKPMTADELLAEIGKMSPGRVELRWRDKVLGMTLGPKTQVTHYPDDTGQSPVRSAYCNTVVLALIWLRDHLQQTGKGRQG
jgi:hypothetical protein